ADRESRRPRRDHRRLLRQAHARRTRGPARTRADRAVARQHGRRSLGASATEGQAALAPGRYAGRTGPGAAAARGQQQLRTPDGSGARARPAHRRAARGAGFRRSRSRSAARTGSGLMAGASTAGSNGADGVSFERLRDWIGRSEQREDLVTAQPVAALAATFDRADPPPRDGDELPPLWHWLYFLPQHRRSELGADGHAKLGGFLPPVPLPRRMWAGSRLEFHRPLHVGDPISRVSRIVDVTPKSGGSGQLVFVQVHHEISGPAGLAISEEQDIVYREALVAAAASGAGASAAAVPAAAIAEAAATQSAAERKGDAPADPGWTREIDPDPVLDRKSTRLNSSHVKNSDAVLCLEKTSHH